MSISQRGPNVNITDALGPIANDPLFNGLRTPIPASWYDANKRAYSLVDQDALYASLLYSRFYARVGADSVAGVSDAVTTTNKIFVRRGFDTVAVPTDGNVTMRSFLRQPADSVAGLVESAGGFRTANTIVNPVVDRWP